MRGSDQRRDRSASTSSPLADRGQTTQDFAVGISVFVLAIAFVFVFVPMIFTPFTNATGAEAAQAERIAGTVVADLSDDDPNNFSSSDFTYDGMDDDELAENLGLRLSNGHLIDHVNITVETLGADPDQELAAGHHYDGQPGASTTRIVSVDGTVHKLVVRVW